MKGVLDKFDLTGKVCIITGGAGMLGQKHAESVLEANGEVVILDINKKAIDYTVKYLKEKYGKDVLGMQVDITNLTDLKAARDRIIMVYGNINILINNAANNPKVESRGKNFTRFETYQEDKWDMDLDVGLKGAFLCSQVFGSYMAKQKRGVILNISSDLGIIAPDQRIYRKKDLPEDQQMVKPVTYSVVKHALIGLSKYLATYWAEKNVRVNAICPGGIFNGQDEEFVKRLTNLIPLGRMAEKNEYKAVILFLISDASSYMTGSVLSIDGGRTCW